MTDFNLTVFSSPTYMFSTFGYTAIVFVTGTLSWWAPTAIQHATAAHADLNATSLLSDDDKNGCVGSSEVSVTVL